MGAATPPQPPDGFVFISELIKANTIELQKLTRLQREHLEIVRDARDLQAEQLKMQREMITAMRNLTEEIALHRKELETHRQRLELDAMERKLTPTIVARTVSR